MEARRIDKWMHDERHRLYVKYPLDLANDEIRLLHIRPGGWYDPIECDFTVVSLNDSPSYFALSYVWGEKTPSCGVKVSRRSVAVRPIYVRRCRDYAHTVNTTISGSMRYVSTKDGTRSAITKLA
jgi:hypothetical protein